VRRSSFGFRLWTSGFGVSVRVQGFRFGIFWVQDFFGLGLRVWGLGYDLVPKI